ncbi:hypothetical protein BU17DRAFT_66502 [Hysterangium stoloniferum]|nr:hypothetical protein BU17DRAFT_66502 [Hysterangium stoloniferum]
MANIEALISARDLNNKGIRFPSIREKTEKLARQAEEEVREAAEKEKRLLSNRKLPSQGLSHLITQAAHLRIHPRSKTRLPPGAFSTTGSVIPKQSTDKRQGDITFISSKSDPTSPDRGPFYEVTRTKGYDVTTGLPHQRSAVTAPLTTSPGSSKGVVINRRLIASTEPAKQTTHKSEHGTAKSNSSPVQNGLQRPQDGMHRPKQKKTSATVVDNIGEDGKAHAGGSQSPPFLARNTSVTSVSGNLKVSTSQEQTEGRTYQCGWCNRPFTSALALVRHVKHAHPERHTCPGCGNIYNTRNGLIFHRSNRLH